MERHNAELIIKYYYAIPAMKRLLTEERRDLEEECFGVRGVAMDGMPHTTTPGRPVEAAAIAYEESGAAERCKEIAAKIDALNRDAAKIRCSFDALNGKYKQVVMLRYGGSYSWGGISARMGVPDSTCRLWSRKAVECFGKAFAEEPEAHEILARASHARV